MDGLLLVDKPKGISSFGAVYKARKALSLIDGKKHKVGHTGTLDPMATGLLVLAVGKYTKKVPELIKQDKEYLVTMRLGQTSSTGDIEGELTNVSDTTPTLEQIIEVLNAFTGKQMQTPPVYSAIKINGQRAYRLARQGKEVKIEPREIIIYSNKLLDYKYPYINFISHVGSGTYIRSLVEDAGKQLNIGAYMADLRRTKIGNFDIKNATKIDDITPDNVQGLLF